MPFTIVRRDACKPNISIVLFFLFFFSPSGYGGTHFYGAFPSSGALIKCNSLDAILSYAVGNSWTKINIQWIPLVHYRWRMSAVHWQPGPGISCSLEAMEARKLRRRLDKMARDRGRLYTSREKQEREMNEKSYSNYLTAALCAPKQLCSSCGHLQLFSYSYSYKNRHACMGTPDRMQCTYSSATSHHLEEYWSYVFVEPASGSPSELAPQTRL